MKIQDFCLVLFGLAICFAILACITSEVRGGKDTTSDTPQVETIESQLGPCDKVVSR